LLSLHRLFDHLITPINTQGKIYDGISKYFLINNPSIKLSAANNFSYPPVEIFSSSLKPTIPLTISEVKNGKSKR